MDYVEQKFQTCGNCEGVLLFSAAFPHKNEIAFSVLFSLSSLVSRLSTKTLGLNVKNQRMMNEAIYCCDRHHRVAENLIPLTKGLISSDEQAATLIAVSNEFKQHRGFCLCLFDIAQVIDN